MNELVITIFRFKFYALIFLLSNYVNVFQFSVLKASEDEVHASIYFYTGASGKFSLESFKYVLCYFMMVFVCRTQESTITASSSDPYVFA